MNEKDFRDLLNEIDSMSIEEYDKFHDKALRMKEVGLYINEMYEQPVFDPEFETAMSGTFSTRNNFSINSRFSAAYMPVTETFAEAKNYGDKIWPEAA